MIASSKFRWWKNFTARHVSAIVLAPLDSQALVQAGGKRRGGGCARGGDGFGS